MPVMKPMKGMKAMKVLKAKKVMKKAGYRLTRRNLMMGLRDATRGGLSQETMKVNRKGKLVSCKHSEASKKKFESLRAWNVATRQAREGLDCKGFVPVGGTTQVGRMLYQVVKTKLAIP